MDGLAAIKGYIDRIVTGDGNCKGMKVLLLDASTTQIVSCVYSQSELLSREVYLVSRVGEVGQNAYLDFADKSGSINMQGVTKSVSSVNTGHMKVVAYLRPTDTNAGLIVKELLRPRFSEYHLFFSGIVSTGHLRLIAENDEHELVRQVQEFYGDFLPINENIISLNCRNTLAMTVSTDTSFARDHTHLYERNKQGLQGMLLSLKKQPLQIRYQASSSLARQLARDMHETIVSDQIFHFRRSGRRGGCLLIVLDRMDDPVTPLLSQWTYQAMVHELLGLNNNRVVLKGSPNVTKDLEEVVLSAQQDEFFGRHKYSNFGELGEAIQKLLKDYQQQTQTHNISKLNTIEDMQNFMEKFPELRTQSHVVSKHVAIMGELARLVDVCSLMDVSQFEQMLACVEDQSIHLRELIDKLSNSNVKIPDKLRLSLLYALRYENSANLDRIKTEMKKGCVPDDMVELMYALLRYAGSKVRGPGLYGIGMTKDIVSKMTKSFMTSVQGVSNVYSQHVPVLLDTVNAIVRGKLRYESHPDVNSKPKGMSDKEIPDELIIFMVGGITYEEATKINEFNKANSGNMHVLLGGSTIHNSTSFLEELKTL